jgi:hypothetical protein
MVGVSFTIGRWEAASLHGGLLQPIGLGYIVVDDYGYVGIGFHQDPYLVLPDDED